MVEACIVVTGAAGLIGASVSRRLKASGHEVIGLDHRSGPEVSLRCDLRERVQTTASLQLVNPGVVVHCAAVKNLLECENNPEVAYQVNVESTRTIGRWTSEMGAYLLFLSSDLVFGGCEGGNYSEEDIPIPIGVYATQKYEAERSLELHPAAAICRCAFVIPSSHETRVEELRREALLDEVETQSMFLHHLEYRLGRGMTTWASSRVRSNPTSLEALAAALEAVIERGLVGIFHTVGTTATSRYSLAHKFCELRGYDSALIRDFESSFSRQTRPSDCSLASADTYRKLEFNPESGDVHFLLEHW